MGREILSKEMEGTTRGVGVMEGPRVRVLIWLSERRGSIRGEVDCRGESERTGQ